MSEKYLNIDGQKVEIHGSDDTKYILACNGNILPDKDYSNKGVKSALVTLIYNDGEIVTTKIVNVKYVNTQVQLRKENKSIYFSVDGELE